MALGLLGSAVPQLVKAHFGELKRCGQHCQRQLGCVMFGNVAVGGKAEYGELLALAALTVVKNFNYEAFGTPISSNSVPIRRR